MKVRIKQIPLALVEAGMRLGRPVCNPTGQILLVDGAVLSEPTLLSLRRRNIAHISILIEDCRSEEVLSVERAKTLDRLCYLFRDADRDTPLFHLILEYRMEALA